MISQHRLLPPRLIYILVGTVSRSVEVMAAVVDVRTLAAIGLRLKINSGDEL